MKKMFAVLACFLTMAIAGNGLAQEPGCDKDKKGCHSHDGFFLRMTAGVGYHVTNATMGKEKFSVVGLGNAGDLAIGGTVAKNLILHAQIFGSSPIAAELRHDWQTFFYEQPQSFSSGGLGIGATYYIMPSNVYLSAGLGFGVFGAEEEKGLVDVSGTADATGALLAQEYYKKRNRVTAASGTGLNFMVGKEWWVSHNWALGLAGIVSFVHVAEAEPPDIEETRLQLNALGVDLQPKEVSAAINSIGFGLVFSATYN